MTKVSDFDSIMRSKLAAKQAEKLAAQGAIVITEEMINAGIDAYAKFLHDDGTIWDVKIPEMVREVLRAGARHGVLQNVVALRAVIHDLSGLVSSPKL